MYVSDGGIFGIDGILVVSLVFLGSLEGSSSLGFVFFSSFSSQLFEGVSNLCISRFFLLLSFGLWGHYFLSCHFHHNMINYTNNVDLIIKKINSQLI